MFSTRAKSLIFILVLLQFVAPLLHAHTSAEPHGMGVHLPEFKHYRVDTDSSAFHATEHPSVVECSIISIGAGIKYKKVFTDNSDAYYFPAGNLCYIRDTDGILNYPLNYLQLRLRSVSRYILLPSRAPPYPYLGELTK